MTAASQDAGQSILPPLASAIAATFFWQLGYGFVVPLFLLAAVSLWVVVPARPPSAPGDTGGFGREELATLGRVLRQPSVVSATAALILGLVVWQAFTSFYPTYLIERMGLSTTVASVLFGVFFALGICIKPLAGAAYDRFGTRRSLIIVASGPTLSLAPLPLVYGFWPLAAITALTSTLLGFATVLEPSLLRALPPDVRGTGFGILRSIGFTVGATSPVLFGAAADRGFFDAAFVVLAAVAGGMLLLAFRIPETTNSR